MVISVASIVYHHAMAITKWVAWKDTPDDLDHFPDEMTDMVAEAQTFLDESNNCINAVVHYIYRSVGAAQQKMIDSMKNLYPTGSLLRLWLDFYRRTWFLFGCWITWGCGARQYTPLF